MTMCELIWMGERGGRERPCGINNIEGGLWNNVKSSNDGLGGVVLVVVQM